MLPVILVERPQVEKAEIRARISFFCMGDMLSMNFLSMYLHVPRRTVCNVSTGKDLKYIVSMKMNHSVYVIYIHTTSKLNIKLC